MTIFGMLRIKNEARWIKEVLQSILPLCERVFILDDHSTDVTPEICERLSDKITLIRSTFEGLDESRDKSFLLEIIMQSVPPTYLEGCATSPYWVLAIDGDEVLAPGGIEIIRDRLAVTVLPAFKLPIWYLWNSRDQKRIDGVYKHFARPSLFRLMNRKFQYQTTPWGGNLHCSSIPQEMLHYATSICPAPLLHLGYMDKADRLRKFEFYNRVDPGNPGEDFYRHIVQGDVPDIPADMRLMHAGPLQIERIA